MSSEPRNGLFVDYCAKDFLDGTQLLGPWEELAYRRIVDMIYATNDQLADDDRKLGWATKTGNRWKAIKASLIEAGKIQVIAGRISNERCRKTLEKSARKIAQKAMAGQASAATGKSLKNLDHARTDVPEAVRTDAGTNYLTTDLSSEEESDAAASPKTTRGKADGSRSDAAKGTRLAPDWEPDDPTRAFIVGLGLKLEWVLPEFRDHWCSVPGAKGLKRDWNATIRNRARDLAQRQGGVRSQQSYAGRPEPMGVVAALRNLGARAG